MGSPLPSLPPSPQPFLSPPLEYATSSSSFWCDRSFIIITSIISFVVLAAAAIHLLLRLRSARPPSPPSFSSSSSSSASSSASFSPLPFLLNLHPSVDNDTNFLITSLPLFSLSSSSSPRPSSSDCGVCLSRMAPNEELRLIPACSHAFHASCIDTWLRSTPSCPLCRSPLRPISAAPLPSPQPPAVELGVISRGRVSNAQEEEAKEEEGGGGPAVAEAAGGGSRSWLRDYADRLASSAPTSLCLSGQ